LHTEGGRAAGLRVSIASTTAAANKTGFDLPFRTKRERKARSKALSLDVMSSNDAVLRLKDYRERVSSAASAPSNCWTGEEAPTSTATPRRMGKNKKAGSPVMQQSKEVDTLRYSRKANSKVKDIVDGRGQRVGKLRVQSRCAEK
jgi:hypothetical protein